MDEHLSDPQLDSAKQSTAQTLRNALRFLSVVRRHKYVVVIAMLVGAGLGVLKILADRAAPPVYQASASLLLQQMLADARPGTQLAESVSEQTYSRVLVSGAVLEKALESVRPFPPEINRGTPKEEWVGQFRKMLAVKQERQAAKIVEITCKSKDPKVPGAAIQAIIQSARAFLRDNEVTVAFELVQSLDKERGSLETRLFAKEKELADAQRRAGALNLAENSEVLPPEVTTALELNKLLTAAQQRRVELAGALVAAQTALQNGAGLASHLSTLEKLLGPASISTIVDLPKEETLRKAQQDLLDNEKLLAAMSRYYGNAHPKIVKLRESIQCEAGYLAQATAQLTNSLRDARVGQELVRLLNDSMTVEVEREGKLSQAYEQARAKAMDANARLTERAFAKREVELLRQLHSNVLERLGRIDVSENLGQVRLAVLGYPPVMGTPVPEFPLPLTLGVGIFFGLLGGLGIVYALDLLDDRFRSPEELSAQLGVPVLAMIRELSVEASTGVEALVVHTAPQAIESEAFRTLRTTLAFSGEQRDRVAITSTEPGDGKTTIAANLGVSYALAGKRTLLIDADLRRPGLTKLFELRGQAGLADVLRSDEAVAELCGQWIQATGADGLDVLPSGPRPSNPAELLGGGRLSDVLAWAEGRYDQVIVDCPPILAASDAAIVGRLTDGLILAVQPHKTNRRLVLGAVQGLAAVGTGVVGVVVNRVDSEKGGGYYGYNYGYGYGYGYGCGYGHGDGRKHDDDDHEGEQSGQMGEPEAAQKPAGTLAIRRRAA